MRNKKGFTLVELIVVIAVLGILVLLAAPKFLGYAESAKVAQIKNDIKVHESLIHARLAEDIQYENVIDEWRQVESSELEEAAKESKVFDKRGLMSTNETFNCSNKIEIVRHKGLMLFTAQIKNGFNFDFTSNCYEIPEKYTNTNLPGKFIFNYNKGVIYIHTESANKNIDNDEENSSINKVLSCSNDDWKGISNPSKDFKGIVYTEESLREMVKDAVEEGYITEEEGEELINSNKNTYAITDYIGTSKNVVIPCEIDGYKVVQIDINNEKSVQGEGVVGAFEEKGLESIVLPDTLNIIGIQAFNRNELKEVFIPDSVKYIQLGAFQLNPIEKLILGNNVTSIGRSAFNGSLIEELTLPASLQELEEDALYYMPYLNVVNNYSNLDVTKLFDYNSEIIINNY